MTTHNYSSIKFSDGMWGAIFGVLAHPHRRFLLSRLDTEVRPLTMEKVVRESAPWEVTRSEKDREIIEPDLTETES